MKYDIYKFKKCRFFYIETYQLETHESYYGEEIKIVYVVITGFTFFIIQIG